MVHKNVVRIYTDGSKSDSGVGCAAVLKRTAYTAKLPDTASVFTAEMEAVAMALETAYKSN